MRSSERLEANIPIFPGDTIGPSRELAVVYLLGEFKTQGAIPLQQNAPLTLMKATALGGGTLFPGKYADLRIIRTNGTTRSVVKIDIDKIKKGQDPDPVLQADDVVFLPTDFIKNAISVGDSDVCSWVSQRIFDIRGESLMLRSFACRCGAGRA